MSAFERIMSAFLRKADLSAACPKGPDLARLGHSEKDAIALLGSPAISKVPSLPVSHPSLQACTVCFERLAIQLCVFASPFGQGDRLAKCDTDKPVKWQGTTHSPSASRPKRPAVAPWWRVGG